MKGPFLVFLLVKIDSSDRPLAKLFRFQQLPCELGKGIGSASSLQLGRYLCLAQTTVSFGKASRS